jgi:hypothetical protein
MFRFLYVATLVGTLPLLASAQTGPGGVGTTDGSSSLRLWVKANAGVSESGGNVTSWADQSGCNVVMTASNNPTVVANAYNGFPAIDFSQAGAHFLTTSNLPLAAGDDDYTFIAYFRGGGTSVQSVMEQNSSTVIGGERACMLITGGNWGFNGEANDAEPVSYTAGTDYLGVINRFATSSDNAIIRSNGTAFTSTVSNATAQVGAYGFSLGYKISNNTEYLAGRLAEAMVYNTPLNNAQTNLVEEYLAAKYDNTTFNGARNLYIGDTSAGDFDYDVMGIGRETDGSNTAAYASGLHITDGGFLTDNGDYLLAGHNVATNSLTTSDVPSGVDRRWNRSWFITKTDVNSNGGAVSLVFDFSEGDFGSVTATGAPADYTLLQRTGTSGTYTSQGTATSVSGDQVTFNVNASSIVDGANYTLGAANNATLPVDFSLLSVN